MRQNYSAHGASPGQHPQAARAPGSRHRPCSETTVFFARSPEAHGDQLQQSAPHVSFQSATMGSEDPDADTLEDPILISTAELLPPRYQPCWLLPRGAIGLESKHLCHNGGRIHLAVSSQYVVIEAQVHQHLRAFLRGNATNPPGPHHLTMARLVARALRLGRSALLQVGGLSALPGAIPIQLLDCPVDVARACHSGSTR